MNTRATSETERADSQWERALIDVGLALLFLVLSHRVESDGRTRFLALAELLDRHTVSALPYSLVGPLFSTPLYLLDKAFGASEWWIARFNVLVLAVGLLAAHRLLRDEDEINGSLTRKFFLLLLAASMFPNHLRGYFAETFTAVSVAVGILAVCFGRAAAGWLAIVLGVANLPATLPALGLTALKRAWDTHRWRPIAAIGAAGALVMIESWIRRGSPFVTGYEGNHGAATILTYSGRPGFSYPLFFGLLSVLLSFGKGVLFYAPGLLLSWRPYASSISRRLYASHTLWIWFLAGLILTYAKWWAWFGGWAWGPRFFLLASVPASLAIAVRLERLRESSLPSLFALFAILTLSVWVGINGAIFDQQDLGICRSENEFLCWYVPEFSALWRPFVTWNWPAPDQMVIAAYCLLVYAVLAAPLVGELSRRSGQVLRAAAHTSGEAWRW